MFKRSFKYTDVPDPLKIQLEAEAEQFAYKIRTEIGVPLDQPLDIIEIIEEKFNVYVLQIKDLKVSGFVRMSGKQKLIFINASEPLGRQYYTAAHELCHILRDLNKVKEHEKLDENEKKDAINKMEFFANKFADYFISPREALAKSVIDTGITNFNEIKPKHIFTIQDKFKTSYRQTVRMLNKIGVLSDSQRDDLSSVSNANDPDLLINLMKDAGYNPLLSLPLAESRVPDKFINSIKSNITNNRISTKKIEYLKGILSIDFNSEDGPHNE